MTAPVSQVERSQKIAMTAPVGQRASDDGWVVSFTMPAEFTSDTIPAPTNSAVKLREIPAQRVAAIRYSGGWSQKRYQAHLQKLESWVEEQGFEIIGKPVFARYNGPFTPWFLRRNEILLEVKQ